MKVLFAANSAWNLYNFRLPVMKALSDEGFQVEAAAPVDGWAEHIRNEGFAFHPVPISRSGTNPVSDFRTFLAFRSVYRKAKPDIVLHFTVKPNIYGTLAASSLAIPSINNISGLGTVFIRKSPVTRLVMFLYRFSQKKASLVFFQNRDDRQDFIDRALVPEKITALLPGSGVDTLKFYPAALPPPPFTFLMIARILRDKGAFEFIEAAGRLRESFGDAVRCIIAGGLDPHNRTSLTEAELEPYRLTGAVEFAGQVEDIRSIIEQSHCAVLPSYREGTPKSMLEAASMGRPLIVTDVPGCREVVTGEVNGYLVPPGDSRALEAAMERMMTLPPEALRGLGEASREMAVKRFSLDIVTRRYSDAVRSILNMEQRNR